eukprot:7101024-Prymnesium_polylepis.1
MEGYGQPPPKRRMRPPTDCYVTWSRSQNERTSQPTPREHGQAEPQYQTLSAANRGVQRRSVTPARPAQGPRASISHENAQTAVLAAACIRG